jgi:hypothetical protein
MISLRFSCAALQSVCCTRRFFHVPDASTKAAIVMEASSTRVQVAGFGPQGEPPSVQDQGQDQRLVKRRGSQQQCIEEEEEESGSLLLSVRTHPWLTHARVGMTMRAFSPYPPVAYPLPGGYDHAYPGHF